MVSSTRESSNNQSAHTFIITRAVVLTKIKPTIVLQYEMGLSLKMTEGKMPGEAKLTADTENAWD